MDAVTLKEGAKLYESLVMGPKGKLVPGGWQQKKRAQRTHTVERRSDGIFVKLNLEGEYDSDRYSGIASCGQRKNSLGGGAGGVGRIHSKLPMRSGHVLRDVAKSSSATPNLSNSGVIEPDQIGQEWVKFKVLSLEKDGAFGIRLALEATQDLSWLQGKIKEEEPASTSSELFDTRHFNLGMKGKSGEFHHRPFTPIFPPRKHPGRLEFSIRIYPDGKLGPILAECQPGDLVFVSPSSHTSHKFPMRIDAPVSQLDSLFLFGAGSGITPLLQIMQNIADRRKEDLKKSLQVVLVIADKAFESCLALDVIDTISKTIGQGTELKVVHILSKKANQPSNHVGRWLATDSIDTGFLQEIGAAGPHKSSSYYGLCGPPGFMSHMSELFSALDIAQERCIYFK